MATQRSVEVRVGLFVLVCLVIGAALIWQFGKLSPGTGKQYRLVVMFDNVGGLIVDANVMYGGVAIGKVREIKLVEDGRLRARVVLGIYQGVIVRKDAKCVINQSGLLGDRYVDVIPGTASAEPLTDGAMLAGSASVDLTEAIRSVVDVLRQAAGTIERVNQLLGHVDDAVARVDSAVHRVDEILLSTQSLTHVTSTLANIDTATSNAVVFSASLQNLVAENRGSVTNTLGKLSLAADHVNVVVKRVDDLVRGAEGNVQATMTNLVASTVKLNVILDRLEQGQGTAGKLLVDPALHDELLHLVRNLREHGLLYKEGAGSHPAKTTLEPPRRGKTPEPARPVNPPGAREPANP